MIMRNKKSPETMIEITVYFNSGNFPAVQTKATIYFGLGLILKMINII